MSVFPSLSRLVRPFNVALVGASARAGSPGRQLFENLVLHSAIEGKVYPVNPACESIDDIKCWPSVESLPSDSAVDVAVIIVSAQYVLEVLRQCVGRGIPFAIVLSSGFAEAGDEGKAMEKEIADLCSRHPIRVYGPNCPGLVNVRDRIGLCFSPAFKDDLNAGSIGLVTQGGGLGRNMLQGASHGEGVGIWFSAGNEVDLQAADFIAHLANDERTRVIAVLMEGIKDGRKLVSALELARRNAKHVVILKIGKSDAGVQAAQSHTASISGSASINSAVFRQFGVIEVDDLDELLSASRMLLHEAPAAGAGLCILTYSGGAGALAADAAGVAKLPIASFTQETLTALRAALPSFASLSNPVDLTADVLRNPSTVTRCLDIVCADAGVGAVLFPIPIDYGKPTHDMARAISEAAGRTRKLVIPVWQSRRHGAGFTLLEEQGLLPFSSTTSAVNALAKCFSWSASEPASVSDARDQSPRSAETAQSEVRMLSELESKDVLHAAGIPVPKRTMVSSGVDARHVAEAMGFPLAMKVVSAQILHKTDVGGVRLDVASGDEAQQAFDGILTSVATKAPLAKIDGVLVEQMAAPGRPEVLVGVQRDPSYGHVLTFGIGGVLVEVHKDVVHRLIPIDAGEAHAMVREIRMFEVLNGFRGQVASDLEALEALLLRVSEFVQRHAGVFEQLEINPVWVGPKGEGVLALDALIGLRDGCDMESLTSAQPMLETEGTACPQGL